MAQSTAVSEPGHHGGLELFLHRLGGCGLSGSNRSDCMAGGRRQL